MLTRLGGTRHITMLNFFQNCSFRKAEILQFSNFPNGHHRHLLLLKSPIFWLTGSRGSRLMSMWNFGKIGQSVAKILTLQFFEFSKWPIIKIFSVFQDGGSCHLVFSKSWIFICCQYLRGPDASLYQISSKSLVPLGDIAIFRIFKMAAAAILDFKSRNFIGYCGPDHVEASACQILSKSVNRLRRY